MIKSFALALSLALSLVACAAETDTVGSGQVCTPDQVATDDPTGADDGCSVVDETPPPAESFASCIPGTPGTCPAHYKCAAYKGAYVCLPNGL